MEMESQAVEMEVVEEEPLQLVLNDQRFKAMEDAAELYKKFETLCLKSTHEADWESFGGRYYLQGSGTERIANRFGIVWQAPHVYKESFHDDKGDYYAYIVEGIIESRLLKRYIWAIGRQDSRGLMSRSPNCTEPDIKVAAVTNWQLNGVTRLLGMRNPSKKMLEEAGLKVAEIHTVDFKEGDKAKTSGEAQDAGKITEPQNKAIYAITKKLEWDKEKWLKVASALSKHTISTSSELTKGEARNLIKLLSACAEGNEDAKEEVTLLLAGVAE